MKKKILNVLKNHFPDESIYLTEKIKNCVHVYIVSSKFNAKDGFSFLGKLSKYVSLIELKTPKEVLKDSIVPLNGIFPFDKHKQDVIKEFFLEFYEKIAGVKVNNIEYPFPYGSNLLKLEDSSFKDAKNPLILKKLKQYYKCVYLKDLHDGKIGVKIVSDKFNALSYKKREKEVKKILGGLGEAIIESYELLTPKESLKRIAVPIKSIFPFDKNKQNTIKEFLLEFYDLIGGISFDGRDYPLYLSEKVG